MILNKLESKFNIYQLTRVIQYIYNYQKLYYTTYELPIYIYNNIIFTSDRNYILSSYSKLMHNSKTLYY